MNAIFDGNLRGSRLGMVSYENDGNIDLAARQAVRFDCPNGHEFYVPFAIEAEEVPDVWGCRCGIDALRHNASWPDKSPVKVGRSHWDMILERRTVADLEDLFLERLGLLYESRGTTMPISVETAVRKQRPASPHTAAPARVESRSA